MPQDTLQIRQLQQSDLPSLEQMDTGIEDDYVIRIFSDLVKSERHEMYGLFRDENLVTIAGYSLFANHFAMLGRLRSDRRFTAKGYATELMKTVIEELKRKSFVKWIGANTQRNNISARKVLQKLGMQSHTTVYSSKLIHPKNIYGKPGPLWQTAETITEKRAWLASVKESALGMFPYECYYPFPYDYLLFSDEYLEGCTFYYNEEKSRFFILKEDRKDQWYLQFIYFWNDHFEQPGLIDTVIRALNTYSSDYNLWVDFSEHAYEHLPYKDAFDIQDPWMMHGFWVR
ncbi:GNAT family N-acetyltransferase [Salirhabdus salicampi]|uniref:GNAT family N-acetyltransferase n=1 Tax=Salirhabdus salicampi TaxID=476102 RepID=UPI0020C1E10C|nr:GNAT family N-acetyltransferase [Salirhabdus salicampi]MCP8617664.1 GNAT family N-acetyltransferase [Salirhabdus salicampi]